MDLIICTILFLAIAAQGIYLSLIIFTRKKMVNGNRFFLGAFILTFSILLLFWIGFWNEWPSQYAHYNFLYNPIPYLIAPFLFFYAKSFHQKLSVKDLLHFLPFLLMVLYFTPFYLASTELKISVLVNRDMSSILWSWDNIAPTFDYLNLIFFSFYFLYIHYFVIRKNKQASNPLNPTLSRWLKVINTLYGIFTLGLIICFISVTYWSLSPKLDYLLASIIGITIYSIGYMGLNHSKYVTALESQTMVKYHSSALLSKDAPGLIKRILDYLKQEKPFLDEDFKLKDLANGVNIPAHHISELLNTYHKKSFPQLINGLRVELAKELLLSEEYSDKKVTAVGDDVGFKSRTNFYHWFKKLTGVSPAAYQKAHK